VPRSNIDARAAPLNREAPDSMTAPKLLSLECFNAAIFDMDGLLIDSEPFWKLAERESFAEVGIHITEEMSKVTAPMTTAEVAEHWYAFRPWEGRSTRELELSVMSRVRDLIDEHGDALPGARETLRSSRSRGWRIALASNAPLSVCEHVLSALDLRGAFDAVVSAEQVARGKPSPDIYVEAAHRLSVPPVRCLAFEDSASGVRAAIDAGMTVVAVPSAGQTFESTSHVPHAMFPSLSVFHETHFNTSDSAPGASQRTLGTGHQSPPN
jgi:mannitol-1-/sugar-/sorbitol-6-/2-deoxyglucose-6-phosphatase